MIEWTAEEQKDAWGKLYELFDELPVPEKRVWEVQAALTRAEGQRDALLVALKYLLEVRQIQCIHPGREHDDICANCKARAAISQSEGKE